MANKSVFLSSAASVESNKAIVNERLAYQAIPAIISAQLGRSTVAIPTQHLSVTIFGVDTKKENGSIGLRVVVSGTVRDGVIVPAEKGNYNFSLPGWVTVWPEGLEAPEGSMTVSSSELEGILGFKEPNKDGSKKRLWFDVSSTPRLYVVLALSTDKHKKLDANGNPIKTGTTPEGKDIFELEEHQVLAFPIGKIDAPICGHGTGGSAVISKDDQAKADEFLNALLAAKSQAAPASTQEVSARSL